MAHDVFISYAAEDKAIADAACARLEGRAIRCWIAPRDVPAGLAFGKAIVDAIHGSHIMVLVFSRHSNASPHVTREVERAVSRGLAILPLRVEEVMPSDEMEYYLAGQHWLDALTPPLEEHLEGLADAVQYLLKRQDTRTDERVAPAAEATETLVAEPCVQGQPEAAASHEPEAVVVDEEGRVETYGTDYVAHERGIVVVFYPVAIGLAVTIPVMCVAIFLPEGETRAAMPGLAWLGSMIAAVWAAVHVGAKPAFKAAWRQYIGPSGYVVAQVVLILCGPLLATTICAVVVSGVPSGALAGGALVLGVPLGAVVLYVLRRKRGRAG